MGIERDKGYSPPTTRHPKRRIAVTVTMTVCLAIFALALWAGWDAVWFPFLVLTVIVGFVSMMLR